MSVESTHGGFESLKKNSPSRRRTAPDPLSSTSAMVASEVSVPETEFNRFNFYPIWVFFLMLDRDESAREAQPEVEAKVRRHLLITAQQLEICLC